MMEVSGIAEEGVWRNDGYVEEITALVGYRGRTAVTVDYVRVTCEFDENLSTSFQMRHVVDAAGNRGFMCYVGPMYLRMEETYASGSTQEVYDEVRRWGEALQKELLRLSYIDQERRR